MSLPDILRQIADLKQMWDRAQPLSHEADARLWRKLRLEWNYHSNHIEGNTLTYGETELLLIQGRTQGYHEMREYEEMKAHDVAIRHVQQLAQESRPVMEADVRDLNRITLKEPFWKEAITAEGKPTRREIQPGEYKQYPNNVRTITGELFYFSSPAEVPQQMAELIGWFRDQLESSSAELLVVLAEFHHRFSVIHPFDDGNGRVMRLLINYALMRKGYLPIIIPTESKAIYLGALGAADAGDPQPLTLFLAERVAAALTLGLQTAA